MAVENDLLDDDVLQNKARGELTPIPRTREQQKKVGLL